MSGVEKLYLSTPEYFRKINNYSVTKYEYDNDQLLIGRDEYKSEVFLESDESFRLSMIAKTRSGKSFSIRRIIGEAFNSGFDVAILPDVKNEYVSSLQPVQKKFRKNLPKGQKATGLPVRVFRPLFFRKLGGGLPKNNEWCSLAIEDVTKPDFMTLCNYSSLSDKMRLEFDDLWHRIEGAKINNLDEIEDMCVIQLGYTKLWQKIQFIKNTEMFDSRFVIDPADIIANGQIPILNYNDFDRLDLKNNSLDQVFLGIWLRAIINARKEKRIRKVLIVMDETARFVPNVTIGGPACKKIIMESIDVTASYGINFAFGFQRESSVPEDLIRQCKFIMVPYNADKKLLEYVLKNSNIIRNAHNDSTMFREISNTLHNKKHRWLKVSDGNYEFVDFFAPNSNHLESNTKF